MSEIYPFLPAAVEVFRVGSKTDMILRKDIKKQEQTDDEGKKYTVYACDERQQRVDGRSWKTRTPPWQTSPLAPRWRFVMCTNRC